MNNNHSKTIFRIKCKILYLAIITHSSDGLLRHYIVDKLRRLRSAKCFWIVSTKEKKNTLNDVFSTDFRICATLQMVLSRNFCSAPKKMILHASKQKYEKIINERACAQLTSSVLLVSDGQTLFFPTCYVRMYVG